VHHKGTLTVGFAIGRPYHIQCACGSAGDFPKEEAAVAWFNQHTSRIGVTETKELFVPGAQKKAEPPAPPPAPKAPDKGEAKP
jgi:hypothetical protein